MATTLTFGNFKGGTGKTTNATMTGIELSNRGQKTLLIDLDPQANATNLYLKTKQNIDNNDFVTFNKTLMAGIRDENLSETIINIKKDLDILPSAADFSLYPRYMEKKKINYQERVEYLSKLIKPLKEIYDWIIIDIPPTISLITDSALYASDYCLIVLQTQERSLQGAEAFIKYIQNEVINTFDAPTLEVLGILPVLLKNNAPVDNSTLESAYKIFGEENIFKTIIKNMERLKRYDVTGVTFNDQFDKKVQLVYSNVVNEITKRIEEMETNESN
ncbi:ParA family protein (plasmid) [Fructilactobacillus sp. Tb1]|uniref:ParA family protein n=1 Tax=Fructilactobacillus sp. Tb1 TaxID=3422304 RepID=UPI003D2C0B45